MLDCDAHAIEYCLRYSASMLPVHCATHPTGPQSVTCVSARAER
jgi:hypothetical protein